MKFNISLTIVLSIFLINSALSQYSIGFDMGTSNFKFSNKTGHKVKGNAISFDNIITSRLSLNRIIPILKVDLTLGAYINIIGAKNNFYGKWDNIYSGIIVGIEYPIQKFSIGVKSSPSIRIASSVAIGSQGGGLSGKNKTNHYYIDIEPYLSFYINNRFNTHISYSNGLNDAIKTGSGVNFKIYAFYLGLGYSF